MPTMGSVPSTVEFGIVDKQGATTIVDTPSLQMAGVRSSCVGDHDPDTGPARVKAHRQVIENRNTIGVGVANAREVNGRHRFSEPDTGRRREVPMPRPVTHVTPCRWTLGHLTLGAARRFECAGNAHDPDSKLRRITSSIRPLYRTRFCRRTRRTSHRRVFYPSAGRIRTMREPLLCSSRM